MIMDAIHKIDAENKAAATYAKAPQWCGALTPQISRLTGLTLPAIRYQLRKLEIAGELLAFRSPGYLTRWYPAKDQGRAA